MNVFQFEGTIMLVVFFVLLAVKIYAFGSSLLFFTLFVALLWVATGRATYLAIGLLLFAGGAVSAHSQFVHVQDRVDIWLDPWSDPKGDGFQIVMSPQIAARKLFQAHTATGKLNALMTPTRPTGCHCSYMRWPGRSECIV